MTGSGSLQFSLFRQLINIDVLFTEHSLFEILIIYFKCEHIHLVNDNIHYRVYYIIYPHGKVIK